MSKAKVTKIKYPASFISESGKFFSDTLNISHEAK